MDNLFVPSGEVSALLTQLISSRLDLKKCEGLNNDPDGFFDSVHSLTILGLTDNPTAKALLDIQQSRGIAKAMATASSLDRIASVLPDSDNVRVAHIGGSLSSRQSEDKGDGMGLPPSPASSDLSPFLEGKL